MGIIQMQTVTGDKMPTSVVRFPICTFVEYRVLGNFRGRIFLLFSWISLKPRKFNYTNFLNQVHAGRSAPGF